MVLSEKIISLRKSRGVSQELLAEKSNISLRTIQRIEARAVTPRPFTIKTLADALGVAIEELTDTEQTQEESNQLVIAKLRKINFSGLAGLIIPFGNIFLPVFIWRMDKTLAAINEHVKKIICFQILWTIATLILLFLIPSIQHGIVGSYVIGGFPPTVVMTYIAMLILNISFIVRAAFLLQKGKGDIYSFVPTLF